MVCESLGIEKASHGGNGCSPRVSGAVVIGCFKRSLMVLVFFALDGVGGASLGLGLESVLPLYPG